jgi:hypothetical protein
MFVQVPGSMRPCPQNSCQTHHQRRRYHPNRPLEGTFSVALQELPVVNQPDVPHMSLLLTENTGAGIMLDPGKELGISLRPAEPEGFACADL